MADHAEQLVYDPLAPEVHEDPYPLYRRLRDEAPAYHQPEYGFWVLSRFTDVLDGLHDWETFSSAGGISLEVSSRHQPPMMIIQDPPGHTRLRKLVSRAFTPRRVAAMEPDIRALATKYLDRVVERGACDLVEDFAARLPMDVVSTMMGIPEAHHDMLRHWADDLLHREPGSLALPPVSMEAAMHLAGYFYADIERRRAEPDDALISALCEATIVDADGRASHLTDDEVFGFCFLLVIAGSETTAKLIANAIDLLDAHPDARRAVTADPSLVPGALEEVLRYNNSTQFMVRTLTRDIERHGRTMPAGERVVLLLGSGNRDEREFDDPDRFDIHRRPQRILSFGHGIHVCLGAALARLEGRIALEELHRRVPDYVVDRSGIARMHSANVHGMSRVPLTFTPSAPEVTAR